MERTMPDGQQQIEAGDGGQSVSFGDLLRRYRVIAGLTQEELAERARLSVRGISDLERGVNRRPYRSTVAQLADALALGGEQRTEFLELARGSAPRPTAPPPSSISEDVHPVPVVGEAPAERDRSPRRGGSWWLPGTAAAVLLVVLAIVVARPWMVTDAGKDSSALTPSPSAASQQVRSQVLAAVRASDRAYLRSRACACDAGLASAKTGPDLRKYRREIRALASHGETWNTRYHSFRVMSFRLNSSSSAQVVVAKDETADVYQYGHLLQICTGPYQVRYHVIRTRVGWRVDDTERLGGQTCHTP